MGCCLPDGPAPEEENGKMRHKILFLGPGGCGKSTFFKQLRHLQGEGFVWKDRFEAKQGIGIFVVDTMRSLLTQPNMNKEELSAEAIEAAHNIEAIEKTDAMTLTPEIANDIKILWAEQQIKDIFEAVAKLHLNGPCAYFFDDMDRISDPDYSPTDQDILYQRRPTSGIIEQIVDSRDSNTDFLLVDVGGQKNERRKWLHQFENISALVFVVSLAAYDEPLYEDETMNSMHDSIELWKATVNNRVFDGRLIYLIFNKIDVYRQKIVNISLKECFTNHHSITYNEREMYLECKSDEEKIEKNLDFIQQIYLEQASMNPVKEVYVTCAYDESTVKRVFAAIEASIMEHTTDSNPTQKKQLLNSQSTDGDGLSGLESDNNNVVR
jgi:GTPase SAR1 family protein